MESNKKKTVIFILTAVLAFNILYLAMCSTLCTSGHTETSLPSKADCAFASHIFFNHTAGLFTLFILIMLGKVSSPRLFFIPSGFLFPIFKPPRISASLLSISARY